MKAGLSLPVLAALSSKVAGRALNRTTQSLSYSLAVPAIPRPYWWQGPSSLTLKDTIYGSLSSVPLPTIPPSSEEPCESESTKFIFASSLTASYVVTSIASTSLTVSNYGSSGCRSTSSGSVPLSHHTEILSGQSSTSIQISTPLPTFIYSPLPSSTALQYSFIPTEYPMVPIVGSSGIVVYPPSPSSTSITASTLVPATSSSLVFTSAATSVTTPSIAGSDSVKVSPFPASSAAQSVSQLQSSIEIASPIPNVSASLSTSILITVTTIVPVPSVGTSSVISISSATGTLTDALPTPSSSTSTRSGSIPASWSSPQPSSMRYSSSNLGASPPSSQTTSIISITSATKTAPGSSATLSDLFPVAPPFSYNPSASQPASSPEASSANVAGSSAHTSTLATSTSSVSATAQSTSIPLAPSAAGASGGFGSRTKEKVWWLTFFLPLLLTL
ncbi:hypothetical protein ACN47E_007926 [Coniothyrium glycines]